MKAHLPGALRTGPVRPSRRRPWAAVRLIGLPNLCGLDALENAAHSLCDLLDRLITTGKWDRDGVEVHIKAHRLLRSLPPEAAAAAEPILDGLRKVRERHAIPSDN